MQIRTAQELMTANLIVKHFAGSKAYGTSLPTSDTDFRGIFCADPVNIRTPFFSIKEVDDTSEEDTKLFELAQFMKLTLECNPNVIETLWVDRKDIVHTSEAYEILRDAAPKLLSSKIAFTTSGYALSQLKRIKGHNKWINTPQPQERPQQVDFVSLVHNFTPAKIFKLNLRELTSDYRLVPYAGDVFGVYQVDGYKPFNSETGALNLDFDGETHVNGKPLYIMKFNKAVYETAKETWSNYWTWKENRNKVRSVLEEQFGYDTKHAMHLVRLLRMGVEALETGVINVRRPDAEELLSIRNGAWTYEQVVEYAEMMDNRVRVELYPKTVLPKKPDLKLAAQLVLDVQDAMWNKNNN